MRVAQDTTVDNYVPGGMDAVSIHAVKTGPKEKRIIKYKLHCPTYPMGRDQSRHRSSKEQHFSNDRRYSASFGKAGLYDSHEDARKDTKRFFTTVLKTETLGVSCVPHTE